MQLAQSTKKWLFSHETPRSHSTFWSTANAYWYAKAAIILGGATLLRVHDLRYRVIVRYRITWRVRFVGILASLNRSSHITGSNAKPRLSRLRVFG